VFLDDAEIPGGSELAPALGASLRRSTAVVVVATSGAIASQHVAAEVEAFGRTGRPIVPIFPERAQDAGEGVLAEKLKRRVFLERRGKLPDLGLATQLESSLRFIRRARIRTAAISAVAVLLAVLAVFALLQRNAARESAYEIGLQLSAQRAEDLLSTSRQAEALPAAIASAISGESRLGYMPVDTWRALWLAYEGAREITTYPVPLGTAPVAMQPDGSVTAVTSAGVMISMRDRRVRAIWRSVSAAPSLLPGGRAVLLQGGPDRNPEIRTLGGGLVTALPPDQPADGLVDASANARVVVRSPDRRSIRVLTRQRGEIAILSPLRGTIETLRISRDGALLALAGADGSVAWVDWRRKATLRLTPSVGKLSAIAVSDDARTMAVLDGSHVRILGVDAEKDADFEPSRPGTQLQAPSPPSALAVSDSRRVAVSFENSGAILVFDPDGRSPVPPLLGAESPVATLSADGNRVATADQTGRSVRVYDLSPRAVRPLHQAGVAGQAASAMAKCGASLLWGGINGALRVTPLEPARSTSWSLASPHERVAAIACVGSGAVTADQDGRVFWWRSLGPHVRPERLAGEARFLAARDGVVAGLGTDTLVFWRPMDGPRLIAAFPFSRLRLPVANTTAVQFFDDGDVMVAADRIGNASAATVERWHLPLDGSAPIRRWRRELPSLLLVHSSASVEDGRAMYLGGVFDAIYRVEGSGAVARVTGGILRPAGASIAALPGGGVAISSLWGALAILDERGRRLITPVAATRGDLRLASGATDRRLFVSGSEGIVSEVVLEPDKLLRLACASRPRVPDCPSG
jgi:WD40 repeat protein